MNFVGALIIVLISLTFSSACKVRLQSQSSVAEIHEDAMNWTAFLEVDSQSDRLVIGVASQLDLADVNVIVNDRDFPLAKVEAKFENFRITFQAPAEGNWIDLTDLEVHYLEVGKSTWRKVKILLNGPKADGSRQRVSRLITRYRKDLMHPVWAKDRDETFVIWGQIRQVTECLEKKGSATDLRGCLEKSRRGLETKLALYQAEIAKVDVRKDWGRLIFRLRWLKSIQNAINLANFNLSTDGQYYTNKNATDRGASPYSELDRLDDDIQLERNHVLTLGGSDELQLRRDRGEEIVKRAQAALLKVRALSPAKDLKILWKSQYEFSFQNTIQMLKRDQISLDAGLKVDHYLRSLSKDEQARFFQELWERHLSMREIVWALEQDSAKSISALPEPAALNYKKFLFTAKLMDEVYRFGNDSPRRFLQISKDPIR